MTHSIGIPKTRLSNAALFHEVEGWLADGHPVTLKAVGGSMWPFITGGRDEVVVQPLQPNQPLARGQIVLARLNGHSYVLHRIIGMDSRQITLMGDGHWKQREHCPPTSIIGWVNTLRRNGRSIDCSGKSERFRVKLWMSLLPIRRYLLFLSRPFRSHPQPSVP